MAFGINLNGPEYEARLKKPFSPPTVSLKDIHNAVPKHLLKKDPVKAAAYVARDITFTLLLFKLASLIGPWAETDFSGYVTSGSNKVLAKAALWGAYYWIQGMVWAGIFCLGHDAGHGTLFDNNKINNVVGFVLHTKATASMERDENYVPYTRSEYNLPEEKKATKFDYAEVFEETPIFTLFRMFVMQGFGWWIYLSKNTLGSKMYPPGTNHFSPSSPLFKPEQRNSIIISNIALAAMSALMMYVGPNLVLKYYLVPYLLCSRICTTRTPPSRITGKPNGLSSGGPQLPLTGLFLAGAGDSSSITYRMTMSHIITKAIKTVLKDDYNYDSTPTFYALYRSFTQCLFIEEEGDIIFYKNKDGVAVREVAQAAVKEIKESGWDPVEQDNNIAFPKLD
ncbi:hypothetical protein DXG01_001180 [Tephrocybe rancida]|nr:hypothetical protein DXG01_001180 [Tephrocybe rancida]